MKEEEEQKKCGKKLKIRETDMKNEIVQKFIWKKAPRKEKKSKKSTENFWAMQTRRIFKVDRQKAEDK